jgi:hypothetical protein
MHHSLGRQVVFVVGLAIVITGLANLIRALSGRWKKHLRMSEMAESTSKAVTAVAVIGLLARAVVFGLVGLFFVRAARHFDPNQATGLDGALKRLAGRPYGPFMLVLVAVGLFAYGLYCLVMARYRTDV